MVLHVVGQQVARIALALCCTAVGSAQLSGQARVSSNPGDERANSQRSDTIVRLAAAPRYRTVGTLVGEVTIGELDGPAEYLFTGIVDILPLRDGTVLILDRASQELDRSGSTSTTGDMFEPFRTYRAGTG